MGFLPFGFPLKPCKHSASPWFGAESMVWRFGWSPSSLYSQSFKSKPPRSNHQSKLGPERLEPGYPFFCSLFLLGEPSPQNVGKRAPIAGGPSKLSFLWGYLKPRPSFFVFFFSGSGEGGIREVRPRCWAAPIARAETWRFPPFCGARKLKFCFFTPLVGSGLNKRNPVGMCYVLCFRSCRVY